MSVHLPVLLRNASKWKETPQTSQHREELVAASKVEGAFYQYPSTSRNPGSARNNNSKKDLSTTNTNKNQQHHHHQHANNASPNSRKRDLSSNPEALKHFFLSHLPSASPSAERVQGDDQQQQGNANPPQPHQTPSTPHCLPTSATSFGARLNTANTVMLSSSSASLALNLASTSNNNNNNNIHSGSNRRSLTSRGSHVRHEVAFGHAYSPNRFTNNNNSNHNGEQEHPVIPHFPSNPRQKREDGEGPTTQTSSVRPRIDRAIWPAPSSGCKTRVIVSTSTSVSMQQDVNAGNNGSSSSNNNNNNNSNSQSLLRSSSRRKSEATNGNIRNNSQRNQDILAVKNIGASNKILASLQQQQDREDGPDDGDGDTNDEDDDVLSRTNSKRNSAKSALNGKTSPNNTPLNNINSNNSSGDSANINSTTGITFNSTRRKSILATPQNVSQALMLQQQQQAKANSVQLGLMLQKKHSTSVVGRAAQAEKLKHLLRNEVLFEDEEIALRMFQANLAESSENGLLSEEQEQQLLDIQQQLLYGTPGYIAGVTGPRAIVNNANRFSQGGPATGPGNSLMASGGGVGGSGTGSGGSGGNGSGAGSGGSVTTSGAGDLVADPSTSPLPFVSIFNGLFPSVSPQTFLSRYIQWVGQRRPKSPVHWNSFLAVPEDPQQLKDRQEKAGSLYIGSVSHEKDLFKSFLTDVSRSSQGFTDGFVRSVLRCLVDYEPQFFDQIVRTVSDHCRREQQMNPQPRSILFQTKTLMREAEVQLRERTRKEEMQSSSVKSHSLGSMYDLTAPLQNQQQPQQHQQLLQPASHAQVRRPSMSTRRNSPVQPNLTKNNANNSSNTTNITLMNNNNNNNNNNSNNNSPSSYHGSNQHSHHHHHSQTNAAAVAAASQQQVTGVGGSGTLFSVREIFRAFVDASFTPIALRNLMVVCEFFDPHRVGAVPHYAVTQKNFLQRYFEQAVSQPTLSQKANWENLLSAFEAVRQETEDFVNVMIKEEARENEERRRKRDEMFRQKQESRKKTIMLKYSDNLQQQQLQLHLLQQELENEVMNNSTINFTSSRIENNNINMNNASMDQQDSGDFTSNVSNADQSRITPYNDFVPAANSVVFYPASQLPPFAWFLAAFVGPRVMQHGSHSHHAKIATPVAFLKNLFLKHYDTLPAPCPIPIADFRHLLLCDDRVVAVLQNYTIPECNN